MKIESDPLFEMAINFLENGGDLPEGISRNANQRFVFQAAVYRHLYRKASDAGCKADDAMKQGQTNHSDIKVLGERVDSRTGWFAGIVAIATGAVTLLMLAEKFGWI